MRSLLYASLLAVLLPLEATATESAESLLQQAKRAYAGINTYRDQGTVRYSLPGSTHEVRVETAFARPDRLRFEWTKGHPFAPLRSKTIRTVIWSDGGATYWWQRDYERRVSLSRMESLANAVAAATGVSSGAAHTIATLLVPDLWAAEKFGDSVLNLRDARRAGESVVDGVACERVAGRDWRDNPIELCIGQRDFLVRRIEREVGGTRYVEERRSVVIDSPVPDAVFAAPTDGR